MLKKRTTWTQISWTVRCSTELPWVENEKARNFANEVKVEDKFSQLSYAADVVQFLNKIIRSIFIFSFSIPFNPPLGREVVTFLKPL